MNTPLNNLVIYNGYPLSIAVELVIHIMIFLTLLYLQSASEAQSLELVQPTVIKALFIDENPQLRNQQLREQRRVEQVEQQQRQEQQRQHAERLEREVQQQREAEQQRLAREQVALREREELKRLRSCRTRRAGAS